MVIAVVALALLAAPAPSSGQQSPKVCRVGHLGVNAGGYETNPQHSPTQGNPRWHTWVAGCGSVGISRARTSSSSAGGTGSGTSAPPAFATELVNFNLTLRCLIYGYNGSKIDTRRLNRDRPTGIPTFDDSCG